MGGKANRKTKSNPNIANPTLDRVSAYVSKLYTEQLTKTIGKEQRIALKKEFLSTKSEHTKYLLQEIISYDNLLLAKQTTQELSSTIEHLALGSAIINTLDYIKKIIGYYHFTKQDEKAILLKEAVMNTSPYIHKRYG